MAVPAAVGEAERPIEDAQGRSALHPRLTNLWIGSLAGKRLRQWPAPPSDYAEATAKRFLLQASSRDDAKYYAGIDSVLEGRAGQPRGAATRARPFKLGETV